MSKLIATLSLSVTSTGGTVKSEIWGKRRLAYTVGKFNDGIFVLLLIEGSGSVVLELEHRLRVTEPVIKFLTVRTDEETKRLDKIKKIRDSHKKASAAPAPVITPAPVAAPAPVPVAVSAPAPTPAPAVPEAAVEPGPAQA